MRTSFKFFYIYLFLIIFLIIGFICGFLYYNTGVVGEQSDSIIDISSILTSNATPLFKDLSFSFIIILSAFIVVILPYSFFKFFMFSFSVGFLFHLLLQFGFLFALLYILIYFTIPLFLLIIMFRIGINISKGIILFFIKRYSIINLKKYIKKYLLLMIILFLYEVLLLLFSGIINCFLSSLIK